MNPYVLQVASSVDARKIAMQAELSPSLQQADSAEIRIRIDARDLVITRDSGQYSAHLQVALIGYLANDNRPEFPVEPLEPRYSPQEYDRVLNDGIPLVQSVPLRDDLEKVRVIVYDPASQAVGSITIPIKK